MGHSSPRTGPVLIKTLVCLPFKDIFFIFALNLYPIARHYGRQWLTMILGLFFHHGQSFVWTVCSSYLAELT